MAIIVKHGGKPALGLIGSYEEGRKRSAERTASLVAPKMGPITQTTSRTKRLPATTVTKRAADDSSVRVPFASFDAKLAELRDRPPMEHKYSGWTPGVLAMKAADAGQPEPIESFISQPQSPVVEEITSDQAKKFNELEDAYQRAQSSGLYTQDQLEEIRMRIDEQQLGFTIPRKRLKPPSPWPEGRDIGDTWLESGIYFTRNEKGEVKKVADVKGEEPKSTVGDFAKAVKAAQSLLGEDATEEDIEQKAYELISQHGSMPKATGSVAASNVASKVKALLGGAQAVEGGIKTPDGKVLTSGEDIRAFRRSQARPQSGIIRDKTGRSVSLSDIRKGKKGIVSTSALSSEFDKLWGN